MTKKVIVRLVTRCGCSRELDAEEDKLGERLHLPLKPSSWIMPCKKDDIVEVRSFGERIFQFCDRTGDILTYVEVEK
jgi:hypothetical protein